MDRNGSSSNKRELELPNYIQKRGASGAHASAHKRSAKNGASPARKRASAASKKRRKRKKTLQTVVAAAALIAFAALMVVLFNGKNGLAGSGFNGASEIDDETAIVEGIYIENTYVGGKTAEAARAEIKELAQKKLSSARITLSLESGGVALSAEETGLSAGVDEVLENAVAEGRTGNALENARVRDALKETGKNFTIPLSLNRQMLLQRLNELKQQTEVEAAEPYAVPDLNESFSQSFTFFEGKNGYSLDVEATAALVEEAVKAGNLNAEIKPVFTETPPSMTLDFIKENTKRISTFTTRFRNGGSDIVDNRVFNIQKAAGIISCKTVAPSEEFSFNGVVGPRTVEGGWKEANGISGGKEYTLQAGGGICQVSTTLYNALLNGNIDITERRKHSIPSDYVDFGLDATVDTSGIDLKFINDTGAPLYIFVYIKPDPENGKYALITVSLYGKPLPEGVTYKARSVVGEPILRDTPHWTEDPTIPRGYQLETVKQHDGFVAEAYLDKYINGVLDSSTLLYTDKYKGNVAEIKLGTGDPTVVPVPAGAVPYTGGAPTPTPSP